MKVQFAKAHGDGNDFLLVRDSAWAEDADYAALARAICDRHRGVGADGLVVFTGPARIRLFNSDGSEAELSGNGTRCAAALLAADGEAHSAGASLKPAEESPRQAGDTFDIETKAGRKHLRLLARDGYRFQFEMNMGRPRYSPEEIGCPLETALGTWKATLVNVGNPQCAVLVSDFDFAWRELGRAIEEHPRFPNRTNVSFIKVRDSHTIEVRFYERGAGPTLSSGTGSTAAAIAAILTGRVQSPVRVVTEAGSLELEWNGGDVLLRGPAEILARGEFYWCRGKETP
jgi:diaminopimelate epimerase